jgi:hypothetical protein
VKFEGSLSPHPDHYFQVLEEEAVEFTIGVWRQVIFESMAYGEGLLTEKTLVD